MRVEVTVSRRGKAWVGAWVQKHHIPEDNGPQWRTYRFRDIDRLPQNAQLSGTAFKARFEFFALNLAWNGALTVRGLTGSIIGIGIAEKVWRCTRDKLVAICFSAMTSDLGHYVCFTQARAPGTIPFHSNISDHSRIFIAARGLGSRRTQSYQLPALGILEND